MATDHHAYLKWPRLIAFNLNGALAITATGLSSRSLVDLNHKRSMLSSSIPGGELHATNVVTAAATMTTAAGLASLYTAALSIAIIFKLQREETDKSIRVKEFCMVFMGIFLLGASIAASIIIVPRSAGVSAPGFNEVFLVYLIQSTGASLRYRDAIVFPALIVTWLCFGSTLVSFILAALAHRHIKKYGPEDTLVGHTYGKREGNAMEKKQVSQVSRTEHA